MGKKTVLKNLISKWTELSIETQMQTALITDQSAINNPETLDVDYVDAAELETAIDEASGARVSAETLFENEGK